MAKFSPDLLTELNDAIAKFHFESVADFVRGNACECYAMVATGEDYYSSVGNTRFGGDPDLPDGMDWPIDPDKPQPTYANFVAQINFAELPPLASAHALPGSGILYLFVRFMDCAAKPVILDGLFYDGEMMALRRRPAPPNDSLCNERLVDLVPQVIKAVPSISFAVFRKAFREYVDRNTDEVDGEDGHTRRIDLESHFEHPGRVGQLLGFANANDERENLYRQVVLARLGKRRLVYNDYWDSMEEYEAYIERWRDNPKLVKFYTDMHDGVVWLTSNREMISALVDEWRLLFRLDSNRQMGLIINDADPLYAFVRHEDLAKKDFSNLAGEVTQG